MKKVLLAMLFAGVVIGFSCKKQEPAPEVPPAPEAPAPEAPAPVAPEAATTAVGATVQPGTTATK